MKVNKQVAKLLAEQGAEWSEKTSYRVTTPSYPGVWKIAQYEFEARLPEPYVWEQGPTTQTGYVAAIRMHGEPVEQFWNYVLSQINVNIIDSEKGHTEWAPNVSINEEGK